MTPGERHRAGVFERDGAVCEFATSGNCQGPLQADHVISRQTIRVAQTHFRLAQWTQGYELTEGEDRLIRTPYDVLIADPRNGRVRCELHHHSPFVEQTRVDVPDHVEAFAADYGLTHRLDRDYGPTPACPTCRDHRVIEAPATTQGFADCPDCTGDK